MLPLLTGSEVAHWLSEQGADPTKSLGQHFLVDPNTIRRIIERAGVTAGDLVVEIGPGCGALTRGLLNAGAQVVAVEIDQKCIGALTELHHPHLRVVPKDALDLDWSTITGGQEARLVANLPYNIAARLIIECLEQAPCVRELFVMVQREVGERFAAAVSSRDSSVATVLARYWSTVELCGPVPRSVFLPQPRVDSVLVRFVRTRSLSGHEYRSFTALVKAGYRQRRKQVVNSLRGLVDAEDLASVGVSAQARAEQLSLNEWIQLAERFQR